MNQVKLIGRLTRDPELNERGEKKVCDMRLAVNGPGNTPPLFIDVVAFGDFAESSSELEKGSEVEVTGALRYSRVGGQPGPQLQENAEALQALGDRPRAERRVALSAETSPEPGVPDGAPGSSSSTVPSASKGASHGHARRKENRSHQHPRHRDPRLHRPLRRRPPQRRRHLGRHRPHRHPQPRAASAQGAADPHGVPLRHVGPLAIATKLGLKASRRRELRPARISAAALSHDTVVAQLAAALERDGQRLLSEREILALERAEGERRLSADLPNGRFHRADLVRLDQRASRAKRSRSSSAPRAPAASTS